LLSSFSRMSLIEKSGCERKLLSSIICIDFSIQATKEIDEREDSELEWVIKAPKSSLLLLLLEDEEDDDDDDVMCSLLRLLLSLSFALGATLEFELPIVITDIR
jgi:hypothetical protein